MKRIRWFVHPVFIFVLSTAALAVSLSLYIYWYVRVSAGFASVLARYNLEPSQFVGVKPWVVILVLSLLVALILAGIVIIFLYNLKTLQLYRLQHTFINNFTHELKTPVTSLKLYLETFLRHDLPREEQKRYIGFMLRDTERLSGNINSILNLTRIESRSYKGGEFTMTDMAAAVQRFLAANTHIFSGADIQVVNRTDAPAVYPVNLPLFEMLLMNILTNAVKYNTAARPRIDIVFERTEKHLLIRFRDNGIGLTRREMGHIFDKFYQGRRHEQIPVGGSGIGLYLVRQIARLHGGKMSVDSGGENLGAEFTLLLPCKTGKDLKR